MTKRRIKNHGPAGFNKSLGSSLAPKNQRKNPQDNQNSTVNENVNHQEKSLDSKIVETDIQEFLNNAELANLTFKTDRDNIKIITSDATILNAASSQQSCRDPTTLTIPRRPNAQFSGSSSELDLLEGEAFLRWKHSMALLSEMEGVVLTPYERNLEVWRQLWRVIERSDVVVQIVDGRNPLLFYNQDLEKYVKEVSPLKSNLLLINKCDLITPEHIVEWKSYVKSKGIECIFWSATKLNNNDCDDVNDEKSVSAELSKSFCSPEFVNSTEELINVFKSCARYPSDSLTVGMIGYPNVGKSSTINRIIGAKKTSVSATPGKTKHFQTLVVDEKLTIVDCPGLVMPSFANSAADMILNGIIPITQIHDYFTPVQLICNRVPRRYLEMIYSILLPGGYTSNQPPTAHEFLTVLAFMKGFMASSGIPDCSRAGRLVLNDVQTGKLKYVTAPPEISQNTFDMLTFGDYIESGENSNQFGKIILKQLNKRNLLLNTDNSMKHLDTNFFKNSVGDAHIVQTSKDARNKSKSIDKKHGNKNKHEKLRRIYENMDA